MCSFDERAYAADSSTPSQARGHTLDRLHEVLGTGAAVKPLVDDAGLVVSELVTNAVNAGATTVAVDLAIHRDHVRVGVADDAPGAPRLQSPSPRSTGGRGLHIIERLARQWGTQPTPAGKQIWAELTVDPIASSTLTCTL